ETNATFSGQATLCINYTGISYNNESNLRLLHFENNAWVDHTISLNTTTKVVCARTSSFSPFVVAEPGATVNVISAFHTTGNGGAQKLPMVLDMKVFDKRTVGSPDP